MSAPTRFLWRGVKR
jgi:hypothetical protein